jgi:hypothetical protein
MTIRQANPGVPLHSARKLHTDIPCKRGNSLPQLRLGLRRYGMPLASAMRGVTGALRERVPER